MTKLHLAIDDVQEAEVELAKHLVSLAERHHSEPDVYHTSRARADTCAEHVMRLRPFLERYGAHAVDIDAATKPGLLDTLRHGAAATVDDTPEAGQLLLTNLRDTYPVAHRAEIGWVILHQAAKAVRDQALLGVVAGCLEEAEQTWKWLRTRIKDTSVQVLAVGQRDVEPDVEQALLRAGAQPVGTAGDHPLLEGPNSL